MIVYYGDQLLEHNKIDDAIGVITVHLFAGIWGTLAVALFADPIMLDNGLSTYQQWQIRLLGIATSGLYSFTVAYGIFRLVNRIYPLRVSNEAELSGQNVSEYRVNTVLIPKYLICCRP
jgi:Amt family ammonium transporter